MKKKGMHRRVCDGFWALSVAWDGRPLSLETGHPRHHVQMHYSCFSGSLRPLRPLRSQRQRPQRPQRPLEMKRPQKRPGRDRGDVH